MMNFFTSVFPDAQFIWLERDPRAQVYSTYKLGWAAGDSSPQGTREELLGLAVERYLGHYNELQAEGGRYVLFRYEDFVTDAASVLRQMLDLLELSPSPRVMTQLRRWPIDKERSTTWRSELTSLESDQLSEMLREPMQKHGYA